MEMEVRNKPAVSETRRIRIREIDEGDLIHLFRWRNSEKFRFLIHHDSETIEYEAFLKEFVQDTATHKYQYLVEKKETGEPIGYIYANIYSEQYKSCFVNLYIDEPFENKGYGIDAFVLFALFLFNHTGLVKLFAQAFECNAHSLSCLLNIGMRELVGNITPIPERGNILCFAADQSILTNLERINKILSERKPVSVAKSQNLKNQIIPKKLVRNLYKKTISKLNKIENF